MKCPNCLTVMQKEPYWNDSWSYQCYLCKNKHCEDLGFKRFIKEKWKPKG